MADLTTGEAIVEGDVFVRVRGRLLRVYSAGGLWFAQVEFAPSQTLYVPLRQVVMDETDVRVPERSLNRTSKHPVQL